VAAERFFAAAIGQCGRIAGWRKRRRAKGYGEYVAEGARNALLMSGQSVPRPQYPHGRSTVFIVEIAGFAAVARAFRSGLSLSLVIILIHESDFGRINTRWIETGRRH
jgi:hypothetical protein